MNVLCLAPELPYPPDHGQRLRTWHLLARLAGSGTSVTLVTWPRADITPEMNGDFANIVRATLDDVVLLERGMARLSRPARLWRQGRFFATADPPYLQQLLEERALHTPAGRNRFATRLAALHGQRRFDVVICEEEAMRWCPLPRALATVPVVVHRLNVFSQVLRDQRRAGSVASRAAWMVEAQAWKRFDAKASDAAALAVATTPETAHALARLAPVTPTIVIPNGVTMRALNTPPAERHDVAFVGWMGYPPNVDAICWFAREIWPEVRARVPSAVLRVVGRQPDPAVVALHDDGAGIRVVGEVPDVADACEGVSVGVAPLRAGMGIKNKTLELMSMGVPVVATDHGAEGIGATSRDGLCVVNDPLSFANKVAGLLTNPQHAAHLGERARCFVEEHFAWGPIAHRYRVAIADVASAVSAEKSPA